MNAPFTRPYPFLIEPAESKRAPSFFAQANPFAAGLAPDANFSDDFASARSTWETQSQYADAFGLPQEREPGLLSRSLDFLDRFVSAGSGFTTGLLGADLTDETGAVTDEAGFLDLRSALERAARGAGGEHIGWGDTAALRYDEDDSGLERFAKGAAAFTGDVLSDPLTYISFGTSIGRGAASRVAAGMLSAEIGTEAFEAAARNALGEAAEKLTREELIREGKIKVASELDNRTILGALSKGGRDGRPLEVGEVTRRFAPDRPAEVIDTDTFAAYGIDFEAAMRNEIDTEQLVRLLPEEKLDEVITSFEGEALMSPVGGTMRGNIGEQGNTGMSLLELATNTLGEGAYRLGGARRLRSELKRVFGDDMGENLFGKMHSDVRGGARLRVPGLRSNVSEGGFGFRPFSGDPRAAIPLFPGQTGGGQIIDSGIGRALGLDKAVDSIEYLRKWTASKEFAQRAAHLGGTYGVIATQILGDVVRSSAENADSPAAFSRLVSRRLADEGRETARRIATESYENLIRSIGKHHEDWRSDPKVWRQINRLVTHPGDMEEIAKEEGIPDPVLRFSARLRDFYDQWGFELEQLGVIRPGRRTNYVPHLVSDEYLDLARQNRTPVGVPPKGRNVGSGHGTTKQRDFDQLLRDLELDMFEHEDPGVLNRTLGQVMGKDVNVFVENPFEVLNEYQRRMLTFVSEQQYRNLMTELGLVFDQSAFDPVRAGFRFEGPEPSEGDPLGGRQMGPMEAAGLVPPERHLGGQMPPDQPQLPGGLPPGLAPPGPIDPNAPHPGRMMDDLGRGLPGLPEPSGSYTSSGQTIDLTRAVGDMEPNPRFGVLRSDQPLTTKNEFGIRLTVGLRDKLARIRQEVEIEGGTMSLNPRELAALDEATRSFEEAMEVYNAINATKDAILDRAVLARANVSLRNAQDAADEALRVIRGQRAREAQEGVELFDVEAAGFGDAPTPAPEPKAAMPGPDEPRPKPTPKPKVPVIGGVDDTAAIQVLEALGIENKGGPAKAIARFVSQEEPPSADEVRRFAAFSQIDKDELQRQIELARAGRQVVQEKREIAGSSLDRRAAQLTDDELVRELAREFGVISPQGVESLRGMVVRGRELAANPEGVGDYVSTLPQLGAQTAETEFFATELGSQPFAVDVALRELLFKGSTLGEAFDVASGKFHRGGVSESDSAFTAKQARSRADLAVKALRRAFGDNLPTPLALEELIRTAGTARTVPDATDIRAMAVEWAEATGSDVDAMERALNVAIKGSRANMSPEKLRNRILHERLDNDSILAEVAYHEVVQELDTPWRPTSDGEGLLRLIVNDINLGQSVPKDTVRSLAESLKLTQGWSKETAKETAQTAANRIVAQARKRVKTLKAERELERIKLTKADPATPTTKPQRDAARSLAAKYLPAELAEDEVVVRIVHMGQQWKGDIPVGWLDRSLDTLVNRGMNRDDAFEALDRLLADIEGKPAKAEAPGELDLSEDRLAGLASVKLDHFTEALRNQGERFPAPSQEVRKAMERLYELQAKRVDRGQLTPDELAEVERLDQMIGDQWLELPSSRWSQQALMDIASGTDAKAKTSVEDFADDTPAAEVIGLHPVEEVPISESTYAGGIDPELVRSLDQRAVPDEHFQSVVRQHFEMFDDDDVVWAKPRSEITDEQYDQRLAYIEQVWRAYKDSSGTVDWGIPPGIDSINALIKLLDGGSVPRKWQDNMQEYLAERFLRANGLTFEDLQQGSDGYLEFQRRLGFEPGEFATWSESEQIDYLARLSNREGLYALPPVAGREVQRALDELGEVVPSIGRSGATRHLAEQLLRAPERANEVLPQLDQALAQFGETGETRAFREWWQERTGVGGQAVDEAGESLPSLSFRRQADGSYTNQEAGVRISKGEGYWYVSKLGDEGGDTLADGPTLKSMKELAAKRHAEGAWVGRSTDGSTTVPFDELSRPESWLDSNDRFLRSARKDFAAKLDRLAHEVNEVRGDPRMAVADPEVRARLIAIGDRDITNPLKELANYKEPTDSARVAAGHAKRLAELDRQLRQIVSGPMPEVQVPSSGITTDTPLYVQKNSSTIPGTTLTHGEGVVRVGRPGEFPSFTPWRKKRNSYKERFGVEDSTKPALRIGLPTRYGTMRTDSYIAVRLPDPDMAINKRAANNLRKAVEHVESITAENAEREVPIQGPNLDKLLPETMEQWPAADGLGLVRERNGAAPALSIWRDAAGRLHYYNAEKLRVFEELAEDLHGEGYESVLKLHTNPEGELRPGAVFIDGEFYGIIMPMRYDSKSLDHVEELVSVYDTGKPTWSTSTPPPPIRGAAEELTPEVAANMLAQEAVSLLELAEGEALTALQRSLNRARALLSESPRPKSAGAPEFTGEVSKEEFLRARRHRHENRHPEPFDYTGERVPPPPPPKGPPPPPPEDPGIGGMHPEGGPIDPRILDGISEILVVVDWGQDHPVTDTVGQAIEDAILVGGEALESLYSGKFRPVWNHKVIDRLDARGIEHGEYVKVRKPTSTGRHGRLMTRWEMIAEQAGFEPQNAYEGTGRDARPKPELRDSVIWHGILMDDITHDALRRFGDGGRWEQFMASVFEPYMRWFRTQATVGRGPGFVVRNVVGGLANARLVGATSRDMLDGLRVARMWKKADREVTELGLFGADLNAARLNRFNELVRDGFSEQDASVIIDAHDQFWKMGLADIRQMSLSELADFTGRSRLFDRKSVEDLNPLERVLEKSALGIRPVTEKTADWTKEAEHALRFGSFMAGARRYGLKDGGYAASMLTKASQFDYGDLSRFERHVMREVLPFYTFTRKNLTLQMRGLLNDPAKFVHLQRLMDTVQEAYAPEEGSQEAAYNDVLPEWFAERMGKVTGLGLGGGALGIRAESPKTALEEWLPGSVKGATTSPGRIRDTIISQANPALDAFIGVTTGRDAYTGQEVGTGEGSSGKLDYFGRQVSPLYSNLRRLVPINATDRDDSRRVAAALSTIAGAPVATIDEQAARGALLAAADELNEQNNARFEAMAEALGVDEDELRRLIRKYGGRGAEQVMGVPSGTLTRQP